MTPLLVVAIVLVALQVVCLLVGIVQGIRRRETFNRWLLVAIVVWPVVLILEYIDTRVLQ